MQGMYRRLRRMLYTRTLSVVDPSHSSSEMSAPGCLSAPPTLCKKLVLPTGPREIPTFHLFDRDSTNRLRGWFSVILSVRTRQKNMALISRG